MTDTDCSCCAGTTTETPAIKFNRPGLPAIAYRIGTQPTFKASLLARLSSSDFPALTALTARSDDDWTIAFCDACAMLGDVLTFYQERIANESYLRTATERRSVLELADLIGYQLAPGVAAGVALAFTLESAPGQPALAAQPVTVPVGTRVQSTPDPGQDPQTFETVAAIVARVEWNAIAARVSERIEIAQGLTELYLAGTATQLSPGDAILIVARERVLDASSMRWDVRWLDSVETIATDPTSGVTHVTWSDGLGSGWFPSPPPPGQGIHVYALRQRAALFGNGAPDPGTLYNVPAGQRQGGTGDWINDSVDTSSKRIDLDAVYAKAARGGWVALTGGGSGGGDVSLYRIAHVQQRSQARYGISGKYSSITADTDLNLSSDEFTLRGTAAFTQSEALTRTRRPLLYPVFGTQLDLGTRQPLLVPKQQVAVSGKRARIGFATDVDTSGVIFSSDPLRKPQTDETFVVTAPPLHLVSAGSEALQPTDLDPSPPPGTTPLSGSVIWTVADHDGSTLTLTAAVGCIELEAALKHDPVVSEIATILEAVDSTEHDYTLLTFNAPLVNCYDRAGVSVNANVAPATHGTTVAELGGGGDASQANQTFAFKQPPLTYVSSSTDPSGRVATLATRINGILWHETPTFYGAAPGDRVYTLRQSDDGRTTVAFGDGVTGARLPSGANNVRFAYRTGIGVAGNLRGGQLNMLLTRPLGVKAVNNPTAASGGQDPETLADARGNAPLRVLTLDRAVSIDDYADYARAFAGIARAHAVWITDVRARGVYVTVGGPGGETFPPGSAMLANLLRALRNFGDPLLPLTLASYQAFTFTLSAKIKIDPDYDSDAVLAAVDAALRATYTFELRAFGQPVTLDEVYATIQNVAGVIAADIDTLYRIKDGAAAPQPAPRLLADLPSVQNDGSVNAAAVLLLDASPLALGVMP